MAPEIDPKLEAFIDEQLRRLPPVPAPASLAPRVLAALQSRPALPWWCRTWWDWPVPARVGFVFVAVMVAGLFASAGWAIGGSIGAYSRVATEQFTVPFDLLARVELLLSSALWVWQSYGQPFLLHAMIVAALCYLACMGLGTAFLRVALRRT
jgi:hypothetical protein